MGSGTEDSSTSIVHLMTCTPSPAKFAPPHSDYSSNTAAVSPSLGENKIILTIGFPAPEVIRTGEYHQVRVEGLESFGNPGEPKLPIRPVRVLIPFGSEVRGVRVSHGRKVTLDGLYRVEPAQMPVPLSSTGSIEPEPTPPDEGVYNSSHPFPARVYSNPLTQSKRGYRILILNLHPVSYLPAEEELSYFEDMTVEVEIAPSVTVGEGLPAKCSVEDREEMSRAVDNPEAINTYPRRFSKLLTEGSPLDPLQSYKYVIITNEELENYSGDYNWQTLCDRKESRGITTKIVTLDWIYSNYSGVDDPEKIRNFIKDVYDNWGTEYVLLGGDDTVVPFRKFWVMGEEIPSDMYYSCLDGTFNYDNDDLWGEPNDGLGGGEVDLYAEVYVGRAPVASEVDVSNFVRKTLAFEDFVPKDKYLAYMVGEHLGFGGASEYAKESKEEVRLGSDNHGYSTVGFASCDFVETSTLYEKDGPWSKYDLIDIIDNGVWVLNHLGHGNTDYAMKLYNSDLDSLANTEYFFAYSQTCLAGHFDGVECWAEKAVRMENGAAAVVMNARYGWGAGNSTDGPSQHFDREFWDAVFGENIYTMGWANSDSKEDQDWYITSDSVGRWCAYELNLFGDPELHFANFLVAVGVSPGENEGLPGTTLNYIVRVWNGNRTDNYTITVNDVENWDLNLSENLLENMQPYETRGATISVDIPDNADPGTEDEITVVVISQENAEVKDNASCIACVPPRRRVEVSIMPSENDGLPGENVSFTVLAKNTGIENDNYHLNVEDTLGWLLTLSENLFENMIYGEEQTTTLHVHVPENAMYCTRDNVTATTTSTENTEVSDSSTCTAHVISIRLSPPHSDYGLDTDNDNLYNYLVVEVKMSVGIAGWYEVYGRLYDNAGYWITSAWADNYLDVGTKTLELRFEGLKIYQSKRNGPYRVYMYLYDNQYNWMDSDEHETAPYTHDQFQPPPARFAPPHSDYGLDTDNDNLYNYLIVEVKVEVDTAGWYEIYGSLYDNNGYWITSAWADNDLDVGAQTIKLRFDGLRIEQSGKDGPYQVYLDLYSYEYGWLDSGEHETEPYTHDEFQPPPAKFAPPHSDYGLDTDDDNFYNYLIVEVRVEVATAGWYEVYGSLYDNEWKWITGAWADNDLDVGTQAIELRFDGRRIERSEGDGPYHVYLYLYDDEWNRLDSDEHETAAYTHDQFQPPPAKFAPPHSDYGLDTDDDNLYNYLVVEVNVEVDTAGWYEVYGDLRDNGWNWITDTWVDNYLDVGTQTLKLRFEGYRIERSGRDGPYYVDLDLYDYDEWNWLDSDEHETAVYTHDQFQPPPAALAPPHSDYGLDTDNDNLYNYLVVEVNVEVNTAGWYGVYGDLYDQEWNWITYEWAENYLDVGTKTLELRFRGSEIYQSEINGPYRAYLWLYDSEYNWLDSDEHETAAYTYTQFQTPPLILLPTDDAQVLEGDPDGNYGSRTYLFVGRYLGGAERSFLKFDLSEIPEGLTIVGARYYNYCWNVGYGGANVQVQAVENDMWTEYNITWNNQPTPGAILDGPYQVDTWYQWYSWDITGFVAEQFAGDKIVSICMVDTGENSGMQYSGFESEEWGYPCPYLEITYLPIPYAVDISISPDSGGGLPRNTLTYVVTVTNRGLLDDTYKLTVRDTAGWGPMISPDSITLQGGQAENATLTVIIPENAVPFSVDNITVTATSQGNENVSDSDKVEAIAAGPGMWVTASCSPHAAWYGVAVTGAGENIYIANSYPNYFMRYSTVTGVWSDLSIPDQDFKNGSFLEWDNGNYIYAVLGGSYDDCRFNRRYYFRRYNISSNSWETLANTPWFTGAGDALTWVKMGDNEYIYALLGSSSRSASPGGYYEGDYYPEGVQFWRYNISDDEWDENLAPNPYGADDGADLVWTVGDYIYAFPGAYDEELPKDNERFFLRYSISENSWVEMEKTPYNAEGGVDDGGSLAYPGSGDYIYALKGGNDPPGGSLPGDNFWRYSISNDNWEILPSIPAGVGEQNGHRLGLADGVIYCWRAYYGDGTIWMYPLEISGVDVSISPSYQSGTPGMTLTYTVTVKNTGNIADNYAITVSDNAGWSPSVSPTSLSVAAGENKTATLSVIISPNTQLGTIDNVMVTATSREDPTVSASDSCMAHMVLLTYVENVPVGKTTVDARPKIDVTVTIETSQAGTVTVAEYENNPGSAPPSGFSALGKFIEVTTDIPPENIIWPVEIRIYYLDNEIPKNISESSLKIYWWDGSDWVPEDNTGDNADGNYVWAFVNHLSPFAPMGFKPRVSVSILPSSKSGAPGATLDYKVTIRNNGNASDTYDLEASGRWSAQISPTSLTIAAGDSSTTTLIVKVPSGASGGASMSTKVTARSQIDPSVSDSAKCTAIAEVPPTAPTAPPTAPTAPTPAPAGPWVGPLPPSPSTVKLASPLMLLVIAFGMVIITIALLRSKRKS